MTCDTINDAVTMVGGGGTLLAGRYRVVRQLGQGGMGSVWLAEDTQLDDKQFAIKMLPSILVSNKRAYRQLKDEALVAMQLVHPNIVQIRAFEENNGNPFLVMDYVDGETLDDYLAEYDNCVEHVERVEGVGSRVPRDRDGRAGSPLPAEIGRVRSPSGPPCGGLPEAEVIRILKPIAVALDYAHGEGVVHRDVKPANVMIRKDGHPFILDFGIAREMQETMTRVTGKQISGTLRYMSPEQLKGEPPKPAQDVYSFAAMVYECLKGEPPFSRGQIDYQILNEPPPPLADAGTTGSLRAGVNGQAVRSTSLVTSVMAGLAKEPEDRPPTCAAVLEGGKVVSRRGPEAQRDVNGSGMAGRGVPTAPKTAAVGRAGAPRPPQSHADSVRQKSETGGTWKVFLCIALLGLAFVGGWWYYNQRQETVRIAEQREREEAARKIAEQRKRKEKDRKIAEQRKREEKDRRIAEQREREEKDRKIAEQREREEKDRKIAEQREEAERKIAEQKAAAEAAARKAETAARKLEEKERKLEEKELNQLKTSINIKVSGANEKMALIKEFRADPDGLEEHISSAEAQLKVISDIGIPTTLEAARAAFDSADKAERQFADELDWLLKNKPGRDAAKAAKAEISALLAGEATTFNAEQYAARPYGDGKSILSRGEEAFRKGDFAEARRRMDEAKEKFKESVRDAKAARLKEKANANSKKPNKVRLWAGGPYWADRNIGAGKPWNYGYYFWWGATVGYKSDGSSYDFSFDQDNTLTHDKTQSALKSEGWITVGRDFLKLEHDAAHKYWGDGWRMPTKQEWEDLIRKCDDWTWTTTNGVNGYIVRGKGAYASNSIFLPAAGYGDKSSCIDDDSGYYWSSVPNEYSNKNSWFLRFNSGVRVVDDDLRYNGRSIRPVSTTEGKTK